MSHPGPDSPGDLPSYPAPAPPPASHQDPYSPAPTSQLTPTPFAETPPTAPVPVAAAPTQPAPFTPVPAPAPLLVAQTAPSPGQPIPSQAPSGQPAPVPGQPMLGQPMAPTYDPAALAAQQPYSAPPVSGPYGYAYAPLASAIPAPPASRSKATIAFASAAVVFLLVAGVFTTMFVFKNAQASDLSGQVTTLTGDRDNQRTKVESLTKELNNTKRDLTDSDEELKKLTEQKKALADCLNAIYDLDSAAVAANGQRTAEVNAKLQEVDRLCTIADRYL